MNDLDVEAVATVQAWARRQIDRADRRARMKPAFEAMQRSFAHTITELSPSLRATPQAAVRRSVQAMETSGSKFAEALAESDRIQAERLARLRRRTDQLRAWLEEIS